MKPGFFLIVLSILQLNMYAQKFGCIEGNCKDGTGTFAYPNGDKYVGEFKNYKLNGSGTYTFAAGTWKGGEYTGQWKDNAMCGSGVFKYASGDQYEGHFDKNKWLYSKM